MERIVVIDSSPLIGLVIVDGLQWLPAIFAAVYLPESVKKEVYPIKMHLVKQLSLMPLKLAG